MKFLRKFFALVAITSASSATFAANNSLFDSSYESNALAGTWILEKSDNPMPDGSVVPYCTGVHGLIIYTVEGYVSVALNCGPRAEVEEPADVSGRKFLYSGKYQFDGTKVTHFLTNASQPELIGKNFVRDVTIKGRRLILSGENQGQTFSAHWIRAEK